MAKLPSSVVGIDLGRHSMKSVVLARKGNRFHLTNYAVEEITRPVETEEQLAEAVKSHLKILNGKAKAYALAVSSPTMILRIIEQPEMPAEQLRDIVRLNGMSLLNQDCKEFVLDCDAIGPANGQTAPTEGHPGNMKYLVGGVPRAQITHLDGAMQKTGVDLSLIQLAPICSFNAFEFAHEDIFNTQAFVLVDFGHETSTVTVGVKKELILIRSIEYGGKDLVDALTGQTGSSRRESLDLLEAGDATAAETALFSLTALTREISSSIGFFEGRREETISKIYVSGGAARSKALLQIMAEELHIPCEAWSPLENCEISVPASRKSILHEELSSLNVACGAAAEALKGR